MPAYANVCEGPCNVTLAPGEYSMALAKDDGHPVPVSEPVVVGGPSILHAHYTDRSGARTAGLLVGIGGIVGGVVMIVASVHGENVCDVYSGYCYRRDVADGPLLVGGIGVIVASSIVGSILMFQHDQAHITVEPLTAGLGHVPREAAFAPAGSQAEGAALALHF